MENVNKIIIVWLIIVKASVYAIFMPDSVTQWNVMNAFDLYTTSKIYRFTPAAVWVIYATE